MNRDITSFYLQWDNNGLTCVDDVAREEIAFYRRERIMTIRYFNGRKRILGGEKIKTDKAQTEIFFGFLEGIEKELESDYIVEVCDGSKWTIRIRDNTRKVKKIFGTVEYPPHGKQIEEYIEMFIENAKGYSKPKMFGCGD